MKVSLISHYILLFILGIWANLAFGILQGKNELIAAEMLFSFPDSDS